ncbi:major facilitator superfamily domain-containing protein [Dactylonectria estremocensis]|uniref:Major facilitator superfamily domain-containing protein n=1 Tax=Dactylonectria estremocensis TaxID=1079267 RepID=A0A9P9J2V5_9HYPO|nr:major facilitator superfamily domain-containing protein [Dactylonectria estremocensis]
MANPDPVIPGKAPSDSEKHGNEGQAEHFDTVASGEVENYQGLTATCVIVYLLARSMVADIGGADKIQWISQSVPIVNMALGAPIAQAADYWGRKWLLFISCAFAMVGSVIISRAMNMNMALAGNALASICMGAQPLLYAVGSEILPRRYRPAAQGGITGVFSVAAIVNLTLREKLNKLDWVGITLLPVAVTVLCIGLSWSKNPYSWSNAHVVAPFVVGIVLVALLALYEVFVKKDGLFHHDLFTHDRNTAIACLLIFTEGMAFFVANTYVPLEMAVLFETNPVMVSLVFSMAFIGSIAACIITSVYCSWTRQLRWPLVASFAGFVIFYASMMSVGFGDGAQVWGFCLILGLGFGAGLTCIVVAAQFSAPPELLSISSGVLVTARGAGAAIGFSICNAIFNSQISKNLPKDIASAVLPLDLPTESLGPFIQALAAQNESALAAIDGVTPQIIQAGVHGLQQAYITSLRPLHGFGLALSTVAVIAAFFIIDPKLDFTMHVDAPLDVPKELLNKGPDHKATEEI